MKTFSSAKLIGFICSAIVIFTAISIFGKNIYPMISEGKSLHHHLSSINFNVIVILHEISAYFLLVIGASLSSRSRATWLACIAILGITLVSYMMADYTTHKGNIFLLLIDLLLLLSLYRYFTKQFYLSYGFVFVFAFLIFTLFYGILGSYVLRNEFNGIKVISDSIYFTVATYSTVSYGDIYPLTGNAKYFVISMIGIGIISYTSIISLIAYILNSKLQQLLFTINKGKTAMTNHIVFMGYDTLTKILMNQYQETGEANLVIELNKNIDLTRQSLIKNGILILSPHPGNKEAMNRARIKEAKLVIINYGEDSDTIFGIISVIEYLKSCTQRPKILALIHFAENINQAKLAGADEIIAPDLLIVKEIERLGFT